jgi:hypothetical protein
MHFGQPVFEVPSLCIVTQAPELRYIAFLVLGLARPSTFMQTHKSEHGPEHEQSGRTYTLRKPISCYTVLATKRSPQAWRFPERMTSPHHKNQHAAKCYTGSRTCMDPFQKRWYGVD